MNRDNKTGRSMAAMVLLAAVVLLAITGARQARADEARDARILVNNAKLTFENFQSAPEMDALRELLPKAKGVFVSPQVLKGAFILGVSGGSGVLVAREQGKSIWHGPAFYTIGELSYGLQLGGESSEVVLLAMTEKGVTALLSDSVKLGAGVGVAAGPVGAGAAAGTANLSADIVSFSRSKGLFGGISLNGAVVAVRPSLNKAYYGAQVDPTDILIRHRVENPLSTPLISTIAKATKKR